MVDKVANVSTVPGVNPITAQIPNYVLAQLQNQRQQQMAAALMQQGTSPLEYDNRGRASWAQSLAKVLQTGLGMSLGNGAMGQQASLAQQGMQAQGQAYGMGQPSASQSALGQGAQQGSVGPTNENAARLAAALSPAQKQGVAGAVMATPYNPQGLPPEMLVNADYGSPTATAQRDALLKNLELTPEVKNNTWQGIQPETARAITISDATNKGFHGFTPGEPWTNTLTGAGGFAPKLPENAQPNAPFTPGSPIPSVGAVPGAIPVAARTSGATAGADASARLPYQTTTVLDTKNIPTLTTMGGIGIGGGGGGGGGGVPAQAPVMSGSAAAAPGAPQQPVLTRHTGLSANTTGLMGQGNDLLKTAQSDQKNNQMTYSYLEEMENLVKSGAKFGPGTSNIAHVKAIANNFVPGIDLSGAQTNQDVMHKLAASLAGSNSPRSDADLANWQARYPSGELTNQAALELIQILRRAAQVQDARANVLTRNADAGMDKLPDIANKFNQIASPAIVSDGQALMQAQHSGTLPQFMSQYKSTHSDWQQRLQKIQQLDGLGAF